MEGYRPRVPYHNSSRGQGARGRGFQGGVGLPDGNVEFPLHPRSRFLREVSIDRGDLAVREVGFYSLYGDMSDESLLDIRNDRSYLRSLTIRCAANGDTSVPDGPWDLDEGFSRTTVQERVKFQRGVSTLLKWTKVFAEDPKLQELASERVDFVSTNSTMGHLMKVAYQRDSRSDDGWIFAAAKVNGKIIISHISRRGLNGICQRMESAPRNNDHSAFWGRRFEVYMTHQNKDNSRDDDRSVDPDGDEVGAARYRSVVLTKLRDLNLLLEAGVDGVDPFTEDEFPKKYVDFTIMPNDFLHKPEKFFLERMFRWWVSNVLADTGTVRVGLHTGGIVSRVRTYQVSDIPNLVQENCRGGRMTPWDPNVCLGFLYALLKYVQATVIKDHNSTVYEFSCAKDGPGFSSKEIPTGDAIGHEYLTDDINSFLA